MTRTRLFLIACWVLSLILFYLCFGSIGAAMFGHAPEEASKAAIRLSFIILPLIAYCLIRAHLGKSPERHAGLLFLAIVLYAAVFLPWAGRAVRRHQPPTLGNLGTMRSALSLYYGDTEGRYPSDLTILTKDGKYLRSIYPAETPPYHPDSSAVEYVTGEDIAARRLSDAGGWAYVADGPSSGTIIINCTHTDLRGAVWASY